jgi:hypothetical protein
MLPSPGCLNYTHRGFGHENRVYLSCTGVVCVIVVLAVACTRKHVLYATDARMCRSSLKGSWLIERKTT